MKKIISSILCLAMMLSMGVTAFAKTNDLVLTYSNEASYEISIPESGNIDVATGKGTITIRVVDTNLEDGTVVNVTATSANYTDGSWYLVNTKDSADKIAYTIGTTDGNSDIVSGSSVLSADEATSATFYVTINDTSKVGTFTDTITFTSEIIMAFVDFTISGVSYKAEKDMTWREWVNSEYNTGGFRLSTSGYDGENILLGDDNCIVYGNQSWSVWLYGDDEIVSGDYYWSYED